MKRTSIFAILGLFIVSVFTPYAAQAGSKGRRNTAIALTAASVYSLTKGKTGQGLVLGAGSYYAWHRYNKSRHAESKRRGYRAGYRRGYHASGQQARKHHSSRYARR
ncbi:MAG: hypothetical protein HYX78_07885 [Armatimonadetes bacterium]|nr:hypothetical protein [Armatimonadota bacterium]